MQPESTVELDTKKTFLNEFVRRDTRTQEILMGSAKIKCQEIPSLTPHLCLLVNHSTHSIDKSHIMQQ